jgi:hypothetical protein
VLAGLRQRDRDGLTNPALAPRFLIRVGEDRAPKVRFTKRGVGSMVVAGALIPWRLRVHDDVRVVEGRLELAKSAGDRKSTDTHTLPLEAAGFGTEAVEIDGETEIGPYELNPGAFLTIHALAKDNAQPESQEAKSDPMTFKIVTLDELFSDLRRRQQELRQLFEDLIKREERLRDRFLDMRDKPPSSPEELAANLESQGQDQREIGRRVHAIERAMDQILDEMYYNRIAEAGRIAVLRRQVVQGLANLAEGVMRDHAQRLDDGARIAERFRLGGADGDAVKDGYATVLAAMRAVLAHMIRVEGFTEIIETMRGLLEDQGKVREATRLKHEQVLRELFGDEKK